MVSKEFASARVTLGDAELSVLSVGIDIGSATTQLVFSRLIFMLQNERYNIVRRESIHTSPVFLTPYVDGEQIDAETVARIVEQQYGAAGLSPRQIDTGVLLMTGTALLRTNAEAVGHALASWAGRLVSLSAGDALEGMIAAHGSGAVAMSAGGPVLSVDVGGGTTKITLCDHGAVEQVVAIDVGARLVAWDERRRITRVEPAGRRIADALSIQLDLGGELGVGDADRLADTMARLVLDAAGFSRPHAGFTPPYRTKPLKREPKPTRIVLSGGITRFLTSPPEPDLHDLGPMLARRLWTMAQELAIPVELSDAGIGATVIGAAQHTVQLTGATISVSPGVLPLRNLPVITVKVDDDDREPDHATIADLVGKARELITSDSQSPVAVFVDWSGLPTFERLNALALGMVSGLDRPLKTGSALIAVVNADIARLLGAHLRRNVPEGVPIVCVDGILLRELDFIDVGEIIEGSSGLPVTVKSIAFKQMA